MNLGVYKKKKTHLEQCSLIADKGPCHGDYKRWHFDTKIGQCKSFSYGGCFKNKNNFLNQEDCVEHCVKPKQKGEFLSSNKY